jgi:hypothetical protein
MRLRSPQHLALTLPSGTRSSLDDNNKGPNGGEFLKMRERAESNQKREKVNRDSGARHSGAMRSIEPGISRFRVWCLRTIPE